MGRLSVLYFLRGRKLHPLPMHPPISLSMVNEEASEHFILEEAADSVHRFQ